MNKLILVMILASMSSGCSYFKDATPEQIQVATKKCDGLSYEIAWRLQPSSIIKTRPISVHELDSMLDDCREKFKKEHDPNSDDNIVQRQANAIIPVTNGS